MNVRECLVGGLATFLGLAPLPIAAPTADEVAEAFAQRPAAVEQVQSKKYALLIATDDFTESTYPSTSFDEGTRNAFLLAMGGVYDALGKMGYDKSDISVLYANGQVEPAEMVRTPKVERLVEEEGIDGRLPIASLENITHALTEAQGRIGQEDQLLVVLWGHGQKDGNQGYVAVPADGANGKLYATLLGELTTGAGKHLYIIDACFSGSWIKTLSRKGSVLTSASANSPGFLSRTDDFARYLLEAGVNPATDVNDDGVVSAYEAFRAGEARRGSILDRHKEADDLFFFAREGFNGQAYDADNFVLRDVQ